MVNELLDLSRIESGGALGVLDLLDLGQVATESVERLRLFADRQGVHPEGRRARVGPGRPGRRAAPRAGLRQPPPQRGEVQPRRRRGAGHRPRSRRRRSSSPSRTTASASRARPRRGSSSASTRSTERGSAARPAERDSDWRSRATSSSSTAGGSGSTRSRGRGARSRSPCRSTPRPSPSPPTAPRKARRPDDRRRATDAPPRPPRRSRRHARRTRSPRSWRRWPYPACDGLEFDVHLSADGVPVVLPRRDARARPRAPGPCRRPDRGRARGASASRRWPVLAALAAAAVPRRRAEGPGRRRSSRCSPAARGPGPGERRRLVVRGGTPLERIGHLAPAGRRWLNSHTLARRTVETGAPRSAAGEWPSVASARRALGRAGRRRPVSRSRPGRSAAARRSTGSRGSASSRSASRPRRSTASGRPSCAGRQQGRDA